MGRALEDCPYGHFSEFLKISNFATEILVEVEHFIIRVVRIAGDNSGTNRHQTIRGTVDYAKRQAR